MEFTSVNILVVSNTYRYWNLGLTASVSNTCRYWRLTRTLTDMYNAHTGPLFKQLRIPKLADIYNSQLCKLMYLFTSGTLPFPLQMVFTRNSDVHSYPTRIAHDPHFVARKNHFFSKFFMYQAPVAWSKLQ